MNTKKRDFVLQFILNARLSGRVVDTDGDYQREQIVKAAGDLYDRTTELCKEVVKEEE
jgi:hypothetical protein